MLQIRQLAEVCTLRVLVNLNFHSPYFCIHTKQHGTCENIGNDADTSPREGLIKEIYFAYCNRKVRFSKKKEHETLNLWPFHCTKTVSHPPCAADQLDLMAGAL